MLLSEEKSSFVKPVSDVKETGLMVFLFFCAILLVPFQNSILQATPLRFLGASLSFVPLVLFSLYAFLYRISAQGLKTPEIYLAVLLFLSVIPTVWGLVVVERVDVSTAFLVKKTLTNTILNVFLLYPLFIMPDPGKWLERAVYAALGICIAGYVLVDVLAVPGMAYPSLFQASHAVTTPRGFSLEQSTFGATIAILCLLATVVTKSHACRMVFLTLLLAFVFGISASKGTMLGVILAFGMAFVFSGKKNIVPKLMGLILVCVIGYFASGKITERFDGELQRAGSVSTRSILILSAAPSLVENPLGVGYSGYIPALIKYVYPTMSWLRSNGFESAATDEIDSYIASEDKRALNIKAQLFEYIMVFGLPGLILIAVFHIGLHRRLYNLDHPARIYLLALFWFCLVSLLTYMPALGMYIYTIAYGVMMKADKITGASVPVKTTAPDYSCLKLDSPPGKGFIR